jgi:hypothetical protein
MKKILLFLAVFTLHHLSAQITVNKSHLIVPGKKLTIATHNSNHAFASSGANQTWDFTDLSADDIDSIRFGVAGWYQGHASFPKANIAMVYYSDDSSINFLDITDSFLIMYGNYQITDTGNIATNFQGKLITFPSTYQTSYTDMSVFKYISFPLGFDPDSAGPIPFIDSIQISVQRDIKSKIDGWGTMKTPLGNYQALKQTMTTISSPLIKMFSNGFGINVPPALLSMFQGQIPTADTSYTVNFWTNDASVGYPLVTYDYSNSDNSAQYVDWVMTKPESSSINDLISQKFFVYPNPAKQFVTINSTVENAKLSIYDMKGQLVMEQNITAQTQVSVQQLANGLYTLQLTDLSNGQLLGTQKISKQ